MRKVALLTILLTATLLTNASTHQTTLHSSQPLVSALQESYPEAEITPGLIPYHGLHITIIQELLELYGTLQEIQEQLNQLLQNDLTIIIDLLMKHTPNIIGLEPEQWVSVGMHRFSDIQDHSYHLHAQVKRDNLSSLEVWVDGVMQQ